MTRSRLEPSTANAHGFSLVELLIATTILLLVMMMAGQLLLESQRIFVRTATEQRNPVGTFALSLLRQDIHRARQMVGGMFGWTRNRLDLLGHPQGRVRYEFFGDRLERSVIADDGSIIARRDVLRDVVSWRWRRISPILVDVELTVRQRRAPRGYDLLAARRASSRPELGVYSLRAAARGGGLGPGW